MKGFSLPRSWRLFPRWLLAGLILAVGLLLGLGGYAFLNIQRQVQAADWVEHTYQVVSSLQATFSSVQDAESAQRAFVVAGTEAYLEPYQRAVDLLPVQFTALEQLAADNPAQTLRIRELRRLVDQRLATIRTRIDQRRQLGVAVLDPSILNGSGVRLMSAVRQQVDTMISEETALLKTRRTALSHLRARSEVIQTLVGLTSLGLLLAVFGSLVRQVARADHAERAVAATNDQLRDANNELRAFSYSVAHDLRAPLRAINGFAQILVEDHAAQLDPDGRRSLERIAANANTMSRLIDDLLNLSHVSMQPLQKGKVEMNEIVRDAYQELLETQPGRAIECAIAPLPPASGDPSLLRQVWLNLIANALKFTRGKEPTRIEIGGNVAGPDFATYFIRDNGAGFDMQYADKLFGAFQRLHRPADFEGTGIGLALVQRIIQRHGGTIWAEGEENHGARFAFTLPDWDEG